MNNVDISIEKLRQLQSMIYDNDISNNQLFKFTQQIVDQMEKASIEINQNYESISKKMTDAMNSGKF